MPVIEIFAPQKWPKTKSFLQSWEWGEFQGQVGNTPRRFLVNGVAVQIFVHHVPFGVFWYVPHADLESKDYELLRAFARQENKVIFIRVESLSLIELPAGVILVKHRQPEHSLILDLQKSLEDLLKEMHQKTRYNIRLAEKKNLVISWKKNADIFNHLMNDTATRDKFGAHRPEYYKKMLDCPLVEQVTVYLNEEPLASAIFVSNGFIYIYAHGASSNAHRECMAPHLLQWSAIQHAKQNGFLIYDFWGVAPENMTNHPWAGVTRFKLGFGGVRTTVGPAFEIPVKRLLYRLFNVWKSFHRPKS